MRPPGGGGRSIRRARGEIAVPDVGRWEDRPRANPIQIRRAGRRSSTAGGDVPSSAAKRVATGTQLDSVAPPAAAPLGGAARQHVARVAPRRHREGVAQIAAAEADVRQHAVVELGQPHRVPAVLDPLGELLEAAPRAAGERRQRAAQWRRGEMVRAVMAGMAGSNFSPEMRQRHPFGPPHRCGATRNAHPFPLDDGYLAIPIDK